MIAVGIADCVLMAKWASVSSNLNQNDRRGLVDCLSGRFLSVVGGSGRTFSACKHRWARTIKRGCFVVLLY